MSRFQSLIEDSYPEMDQAIQQADALVGEREIEVLQLFCASDDEGRRLLAALRAGGQDVADAVQDFARSRDRAPSAGAEMGMLILVTLIRAAQLGCHLGQAHLMSIKPAAIKARLNAFDAAARKRERD